MTASPLDVTPVFYTVPMATLSDICDPALVADAINEKMVIAHTDSSGLRLLNYTDRATYKRVWNPATLACRGLILDPQDRVLARPFPKFFGVFEPIAPPAPVGVYMQVTDKLDGSLGIAYHHPDGDIRLCTRGWLSSQQAIEATRIWRERYSLVTFDMNVTPLFEIIYPENRIVVDYGDIRDLFLLAVIDHATGADLPLDTFDWPGPTVGTYQFDTFTALTDHVMQQEDDTREGYVVRFGDEGGDTPNLRLKFKFPGYVVAHRIATGLNSMRIWEAAAVGVAQAAGLSRKIMVTKLQLSPKTIDGLIAHGNDPVEGLRSSVPEEFLPWYDMTVADLRSQADRRYELYERLTAEARQQSGEDIGKAFAISAQKLAAAEGLAPDPIYGMSRERPDVHASIWAQVRPESREFATRDIPTTE